MRRREFIAGLGAAAWPLAARGQQGERMRRVGMLMPYDENGPGGKADLAVFTRELAELGWTAGRNLRMDIRWVAANLDRMRMSAKELVDLQPDVIFADTTPATAALQRETRTIPIVFVIVSDPVGAGFVASLAHPGGNITGFINMEAGMVGKWLGLLTEISPGLQRVAILFNPETAPGGGSYFLSLFEAAARSLKVQPITTPARSDGEIETIIASLGREPKGGVVVMPDQFMFLHRATVISLTARNNVVAIHWSAAFARDGGLLSYGTDPADLYHRAAPYIDRILRGAKPAELPVQLPVKFNTVVNLKTAKALGLTIPPNLLAIADEVVE